MKRCDEIPDWMKDTALVKKWHTTKAEIEQHKWIESEKAGHDIGWDRALLNWTRRFARELDEKAVLPSDPIRK